MDREERGRTGERLARELLVAHGLETLETNWRSRVGEIDLVMREPSDGTIVFVEVRYRDGDAHGGGLESVDAGKRARLRRAALAWLQRHADPDDPARIDVVAIGPRPEGLGSDAAFDTGPGTQPDASRGAGRSAERGTETGVVDAATRPERVVARRGDLRIEWVVSAVEADD